MSTLSRLFPLSIQIKCEQYWQLQRGDVVKYDNIIVKTASVSNINDYNITIFSLENTQVGRSALFSLCQCGHLQENLPYFHYTIANVCRKLCLVLIIMLTSAGKSALFSQYQRRLLQENVPHFHYTNADFCRKMCLIFTIPMQTSPGEKKNCPLLTAMLTSEGNLLYFCYTTAEFCRKICLIHTIMPSLVGKPALFSLYHPEFCTKTCLFLTILLPSSAGNSTLFSVYSLNVKGREAVRSGSHH